MKAYLARMVFAVSFAMSLLPNRYAYGKSDLSPNIFAVYSKTGNEVIHGDCNVKDYSNPDLVTCNFADLTITAPKPLSDENRLFSDVAQYAERPTPALASHLEDELHALVRETQAELQRRKKEADPFASEPKEKLKAYREMLEKLQANPSKFAGETKAEQAHDSWVPTQEERGKILNDPNVGPKTKELWRQFVAAASAKDSAKMLNLMNAKGERTCGSYLASYSLDFKKIGKGKWLSNEGPQGLCKIVRIYELDSSPDAPSLWTFTQKNITVGDTDNAPCKGFANAEQAQPIEVFSWNYSSEFELPCEFVNWNVLNQ